VKETVAIDPDKVEQASSDILALMEEFGTRTTSHSSEVANAMAAIDIQAFAFRSAHATVSAFWATRAQGARKRLEEAAYFLATHAATARDNDEEAEGDLVTLEAEVCVSLDEYTKADYYKATSTTPPTPTGEDGAMPVNGESVAV
jgi:hypothetical protein